MYRVAKKWFFRGSAKIKFKVSCEDFTCFCCLTTTLQPTPPTPNTYSILNFWL